MNSRVSRVNPQRVDSGRSGSSALLGRVEFLRYWLGAYFLAALALPLAGLLSAGGLVLGGPGNPAGEVLFILGGIAGFIIGCILGFIGMFRVVPKRGEPIASRRSGAIGAGTFYFLIVQLFTGLAILKGLESTLPRCFSTLPVQIATVGAVGALVSSFFTTLFMAYQDRRARREEASNRGKLFG
jgi:hypothetical protein